MPLSGHRSSVLMATGGFQVGAPLSADTDAGNIRTRLLSRRTMLARLADRMSRDKPRLPRLFRLAIAPFRVAYNGTSTSRACASAVYSTSSIASRPERQEFQLRRARRPGLGQQA